MLPTVCGIVTGEADCAAAMSFGWLKKSQSIEMRLTWLVARESGAFMCGEDVCSDA